MDVTASFNPLPTLDPTTWPCTAAQAVMESWQADMNSSEQHAAEQEAQQQALDATSFNMQELLLSVARLARPEAQQQGGSAAAAAAGAAVSSDDKKKRTGQG